MLIIQYILDYKLKMKNFAKTVDIYMHFAATSPSRQRPLHTNSAFGNTNLKG